MTGNRTDCTWNHLAADENEMLSQTEALPMYQPHDKWLLFNQLNQLNRGCYSWRSQNSCIFINNKKMDSFFAF